MTTNVEKSLNDVFNIANVPDDLINVHGQNIATNSNISKRNNENIDIEQDFDLARENIKKLIDQGTDLLSLAIQIAEGNQDSRSIDAVTKLIGQLSALNRDLVYTTAKKQDTYIKNKKDEETIENVPAIVNNTMYVGNTTDLIDMLKHQKESKDND